MRVCRFVLCYLFRLCLFLGSATGERGRFVSLGLLSLRFRRCLLPFCGVSRRAIVFLVLPYFQLHTSILILQGLLLEERILLLANPTYVHDHKTYVEKVYKCSIINLISYYSSDTSGHRHRNIVTGLLTISLFFFYLNFIIL